MIPKIALASALLLAAGAPPVSAAIVGSIPPARAVTAERIATLPADQRAAWLDYLARSDRQRAADHAYVQAELEAAGRKELVLPREGRGGMPLDQAADWYGSAEALHTADVIVSYQTPNGGWGKNLNMHDHVREPGESFIGNNLSAYLAADDYDRPRDNYWNYFGTLDNNATTTQLRFLAHVITAIGPTRGALYRAAFLRGVDYLFAAQYPNGGWPQVWPLEGGYHDTITFNDDAVTQSLEVLEGVAEGTGIYAFTPQELRQRAAPAAARGIACILATQIVVNGHRTAWCQQHDALTLEPASARNFEPPAECADESSNVVNFLMTLPQPSPDVVASVNAAAAWFKKTAIHGEKWSRSRLRPPFPAPAAAGPTAAPVVASADGSAPPVPPRPTARPPRPPTRLVPSPGAGPIWARYYQIGTDLPIFGDRDKTIHDRVEELSLERQYGYNWYNDGPATTLATYATWSTAHPAPAR